MHRVFVCLPPAESKDQESKKKEQKYRTKPKNDRLADSLIFHLCFCSLLLDL